jgi:hypothetical protein
MTNGLSSAAQVLGKRVICDRLFLPMRLTELTVSKSLSVFTGFSACELPIRARYCWNPLPPRATSVWPLTSPVFPLANRCRFSRPWELSAQRTELIRLIVADVGFLFLLVQGEENERPGAYR